jgi:hypothetical protein
MVTRNEGRAPVSHRSATRGPSDELGLSSGQSAADERRPDRAATTGDLELVAVRYAEGRDDSIGVAALRWRDEENRVRQSTRARLVLYVERGGTVSVNDDGTPIPVEAASAADGGGEILRATAHGAELILTLPRF